MSSRRLAAFLAATAGREPASPDDLMMFTGSLHDDPPIDRPALLDLVAARSVFVSGPIPASTRIARWTPVGRHGVHQVFRNDAALPRAYVVTRARFVPDEGAALAAITDAGFDGHGEAVVVGAPIDALTGAPATSAVPAEIVVDEPDRVVVDVAPARTSLLVLADAFAPGWSATVDGTPAPVRQTNHLVRGVVVNAGARRVEFRYRAPGFAPGVAGALGAWAIVLAGLVVGQRRARG